MSQKGFIAVNWNDEKHWFNACSCKICQETASDEGFYPILHPRKLLETWNHYANNERSWQQQAQELFIELNSILDAPAATSALKMKDGKKEKERTVDEIKGASMADLKVRIFFF